MIRRRIIFCLSILALSLPVAPASGSGISIAICGEPGRSITIPMEPDAPDEKDDCRQKACHAAGDRRKKGGSQPFCQ